ncbi:hypothetical protein [Bosea sp. OK403]|uniref:hypothetical protein n=1 Tax=Bosea sp. OK403 TaxID=1855286 RepID=UPI000B8A22B7|nr:hypothetical protein [Bosea sp. OK403]
MHPNDIADFWSECSAADRVHPRDRTAWDRLRLGFSPNALPAGFVGPILSAPVVLLFLSPGLHQSDEAASDNPVEQARYVRIRAGREPLPDKDWPAGYAWFRKRVAPFTTDYENARHRIAVLNIGGYKSVDFTDHGALTALPSSRFAVTWAQDVLFPQAERGERVVVCLRASKWWGLTPGQRYAGKLFAPMVNRAGDISRDQGSGPTRSEIEEAVLAAL